MHDEIEQGLPKDDADAANDSERPAGEGEQTFLADHIGRVEVVPISSLLPADSPRLAGEDISHARVLADVECPLPPILVHRRTMRVIDGMHRLRAAMMRGRDTIEVRFFEGSEDRAFLLAVKENIAHGLPLSLADREAAAARILASQPQWSDRAIAASTGLAARTVAAIRERSTAHSEQLNARVGRDGRVRPLDGAQGRLRAGEILAVRPDLSLREVAREAGISVATARDVRERIRQGRDPLPPKQRTGTRQAVLGAGSEETAPPPPVRPALRSALRPAPRTVRVATWSAVRQKLLKDPALKYAESGRAFLNWFDAHVVDQNEWQEVIAAVPLHWTNDIAALARSSAERWSDIARALEHRRKTSA